MNHRGLDRFVRVLLALLICVHWGEHTGAAEPPTPARVEKVRAILFRFDRPSKTVTYERANAYRTASIAEAALEKFAELKPGQKIDMRLQINGDGSAVALDVRKPGRRVDYLLFLVGALIVQLVPAG